jgi:hypothetical protein
MNIREFRVELYTKGKTALWLANELGYSPAYMYRMIKNNNEKEVKRIKKILSEVK